MMFLPNSERQINLSSSDYRTPTSILSSLGFNANYNPLNTDPVTNPTNLNGVNNMMDNYNSFWSHTVPTNMPWAQPQMQPNPTNLNPFVAHPYIMRFTAGPSIYRTGTCTSNLHLKRRKSSDDEDLDENIGQPPTKQYISEDKVTAKFNEMSLSNVESLDHANSPTREDDEFESEEEISNDDLKPTIVLSDEVKQALNARNDRIERLFQDELNKSTKSLVLWQPPIGLLPPPLNVYQNEKKEEEETTINIPKSFESLEVDVDTCDNCLMDANEMMDL
ncbi:uncharacterized protein LOC128396849 isoform X2 [Panonychus citri]|uniref:uncharacterized protein LOC128396849 isoform X2 n=1 Tax=Panonychus citri TaxID=50023 RepID=UPI00230721E2|nr:uncharacterized protein LOC128396849 isoform X2 [Panonychus citri]